MAEGIAGRYSAVEIEWLSSHVSGAQWARTRREESGRLVLELRHRVSEPPEVLHFPQHQGDQQ